MSDFKAKMYQIQFNWGSAPNPAGGPYSAPPDPLAGLRGLLLRGRERRDGKGEERGGEEKGRVRDATPSRPPNPYF